MKKVKSLNGYSIFEAGPRDVDKYGYEAGSFYVFFSSDIRDFGIANSSPEYDGLDTLEAAEACCLGNYAKAREIVEGSTTAASFEEIAEVERQLDNGEIDDVIAGTFFLCAAPPDSDRFASLTEEQIARYAERFRAIELFPGGTS